MTTIAAITDGTTVYMGSDSSCSSPSEIYNLKSPKIIQKDELLIGVTGSLRGIQLLDYFLALEPKKNYISDKEYIFCAINTIKQIYKENDYSVKFDDQENTDDQYLIGYRGRIYCLDGNYQFFEITKPYMAIGSGIGFAYGSLFCQEQLNILTKDPEQAIRRSIEASIEFSPTVQGEIKIFKVTKKE